MAGTVEGAKKATATNKKKHDAEYLKKYGMTFYQYIGSQGGKYGTSDGVIKGFAAMPREKRVEAGMKGGTISRRKKNGR